MILLPEARIDRTIAHHRIYIFGGLALMILPFLMPRGLRFGLFTGFTLYGLGVYSFAFQKWRTEPGLWMLAGFLTLLLGPIYVYFSYLRCRHHFQQPPLNQVGQPPNWSAICLTIDCGIALGVFLKTVRLAMSVACKNWKRTRSQASKSPKN